MSAGTDDSRQLFFDAIQEREGSMHHDLRTPISESCRHIAAHGDAEAFIQAADFPNVFTNFLRINVYATDEFDAGLLQEYLDAGLTDGAEAKLDDPNRVHGLPAQGFRTVA